MVRFKKTDGLIRLRYWAQTVRPTTPELRAKLLEIIDAWVQATLSPSPVSRSSFLQPSAHKRTHFCTELRIYATKAHLWKRIEALLAEERLDQLFMQALKRHERSAPNPAQLRFEGVEFEYLPPRIQAGATWLPLATAKVKDLLSFAASYEKRARKDSARGADLLRLATIIRDQPAEMSVADALARITASKTGTAGK